MTTGSLFILIAVYLIASTASVSALIGRGQTDSSRRSRLLLGTTGVLLGLILLLGWVPQDGPADLTTLVSGMPVWLGILAIWRHASRHRPPSRWV